MAAERDALLLDETTAGQDRCGCWTRDLRLLNERYTTAERETYDGWARCKVAGIDVRQLDEIGTAAADKTQLSAVVERRTGAMDQRRTAAMDETSTDSKARFILIIKINFASVK